MGVTNVTFKSNFERINRLLWENYWDPLSNGALIIIGFYANDTLGHVGCQEVVVKVIKSSETQNSLSNPTG